jgi:hypothetical protein
MWAIIGAGLATIIALIVATFLVAGAERFWGLFGEPDLGPVSFEQLERRATPNDSVACPPDFCKARVDVTTRLYPVTAHELRLVFAKVIASESACRLPKPMTQVEIGTKPDVGGDQTSRCVIQAGTVSGDGWLRKEAARHVQ